MYANYHTHTALCNHASGTMREYVESAIKSGIKILGFSDHVPSPFPNGYTSYFRMKVSETEVYVKELIALREEFKDKIKIYIGYEAEYYPKLFDSMLENIKQYECDYLILGQHFINNEYDGVYSGNITEDSAVLTAYVDQVLKAISTKKFSYIAHPDLIRFYGDEEIYKKEITRMCIGAKQYGIPLEINLLGLKQKRWYPNEEFWKIAAKVDNEAVIGCDAHESKVLLDKATMQQGIDFAKRFNIKLLDEVNLIKP